MERGFAADPAAREDRTREQGAQPGNDSLRRQQVLGAWYGTARRDAAD